FLSVAKKLKNIASCFGTLLEKLHKKEALSFRLKVPPILFRRVDPSETEMSILNREESDMFNVNSSLLPKTIKGQFVTFN
ncbi:hypothetical protein, partial [Klebsiella michiganensis]|uniref:hypothetical protein n=1 Tax=Klebsiella michiganensis TaxID=1134687 RepID=UPI001954CEC8